MELRKEERVRTLAQRLKSDQGFADALAAKVDALEKDEREIVIAAVVASGVCDGRIVRAIRRDFGASAPLSEGVMKLEEFEKDFDQRAGLKGI